MRRNGQRKGFVLFEQILALSVFAIVGVALATALNEVARLAAEARKEAVVARLLDSELRAAMSVPNLEELEEEISLEELGVDILTTVQPIEEMESEEGKLLQQMWLVRVEATWWENNEEQDRMVETWRYGRLYVP